ncbi:MAG: NAD(P)H-dependent glycerol-3-phosphate dehydrogenase [Candidatus Njordarchaeota archaeon]
MIVVIGAGAMGTAIAKLIADNGYDVYLWARRRKVVDDIIKYRENKEYYPGLKLPKNIFPTDSLEVVAESNIVFIATPSHAVRAISREIKKYVSEDHIIVNLAKGIEYNPFMRLSEVIKEEIGSEKIAVLSGPNFAIEIIRRLPTGTTLASYCSEVLEKIKNILSNDFFIVQTTKDVIGVEMGGVLKNIYAIAMGICKALDINENAYYFILSEAFREMRTIIENVGGKIDSLFLSSGFGDLCLTSSSDKSRNRILGFICGKRMLDNINGKSVVFEGKKSVRAMMWFAEKNNLKCPVMGFVYDVLIDNRNPYFAYKELWKKLREVYSK